MDTKQAQQTITDVLEHAMKLPAASGRGIIYADLFYRP